MFVQLLFFGPGLPVDTVSLTRFSCLTLYRSMNLFTAFFYEGKSVKFLFFKLNTGALTGVWTGAVSLSLSLHGLHSNQCLAPCYTPFFKVNCIYFEIISK